MDKYINQITIQTLRWIYHQNREAELLRCSSVDEIKRLIWKYVAPTFGKSHHEPGEHSIQVMGGKNQTPGVFHVPVAERRRDKDYEEDKESFLKGIKMVDFEALLVYIKEKNGEKSPPHLSGSVTGESMGT